MSVTVVRDTTKHECADGPLVMDATVVGAYGFAVAAITPSA